MNCSKCGNSIPEFKIEIRDGYTCWKCNNKFRVLLIDEPYIAEANYEYASHLSFNRPLSLAPIAFRHGVLLENRYVKTYKYWAVLHVCQHCKMHQRDEFVVNSAHKYENSEPVSCFKISYCKDCDKWYEEAWEETIEKNSDTAFVAIDFETTGLSPIYNRIIEIGAVKVLNNHIIDTYQTLVNPLTPIPYQVTRVNNITDDMVKNSPTISQVLPAFLDFIGNNVLVAHNAQFDMGFLKAELARCGLKLSNKSICTLELSRMYLPLSRHNLASVSSHFGIHQSAAHRALDDAKVAAQIFIRLNEI